MKTLRRLLCILVLSSFFGASLTPPSFAYTPFNSSGLLFELPKPGTMVHLSPVFNPVLIKGLKVHPENPFVFDFIVDPGDEKLEANDFKKTSQRLINYFLASLTIPQQDLWVNLSPFEKNHIIPDTLIKTELGRDLLAEDYMLKQVSASLIFPESGLGKTFWRDVYDQAYRRFGVTQIPVNTFNKIWILPQKSSVYEKGNSVYIVNAHLKVMLEEDMLAQERLGGTSQNNRDIKDISRQILREIVVPAVEKAVNQDANFAQLRQVFYSLILAQWYQDVFKQSILNKIYSGQSKVAGIDVSDPKNKDLIYHQYLAAYKRGVFNYIKEDTDRLTQQPIPRKYFSGGFVDQIVKRQHVSLEDFESQAMIAATGATQQDVRVDLRSTEEPETYEKWNDLNRPLVIFQELKALVREGRFDRPGLYALIDKYSRQIDSMKLYPVQSAWPVLKAITLLTRSEENDLLAALHDQQRYTDKNRPELVDKIYLMNNFYDPDRWLRERAPQLTGRRIYLAAAEIHYWAGGLGPVMKFHGKGMKDLGADVAYIEPWYQLRRDKGNPNGDPLDYSDSDIKLKNLEDYDQFYVKVGNINGRGVNKVLVKVVTGLDENNVRVYMFKDDNNGQSYYTRMLYNYGGQNNPVSKEESMAFLNVASAKLIELLEIKRRKQQGDSWKPAIVHTNDGQYAPLQAVALSQYGSEEVIKNIFWAFTTHTYGNRGGNNDVTWGINVFLKHMMGIKNLFINAFRRIGFIDHTSGGVRLANWAGAVSNKHRDDMQGNDPHVNLTAVTNGAVPEEMASVFHEEFRKLQAGSIIAVDADVERPGPLDVEFTKIACKKRLNEAKIKTANGSVVQIDTDRPLIGYARRLVPEKAGRERAFSDDNIWMLVQLGYNVLLMGNHQGTATSEDLAKKLRELEGKIAAEKIKRPADFPGSFQFVQSFTATQKKIFLAAADIQIQDSDNHTGAAEFSEEDIDANAGLEGGDPFREGVIVDQGLPLDYDHPGLGQTLIPKEATAKSWLETVFIPLMKVWNQGPNHVAFYTNLALSPRLDRIERYLITSATYLRQYNDVLVRQQREAQQDHDTQQQLAKALSNDKETLKGVLFDGRNGVKEPFGFVVANMKFETYGKGLIPFLNEKHYMEDIYGYDTFMHHYLDSHFQEYLKELFNHTPAAKILDRWITNLEDEPDISTQDRMLRLDRFLVGLKEALQNTLNDQAMLPPGGIKLDNIPLERHGQLMADFVTDKAFENMFHNARGLYGLIVGIRPISNLQQFIQ